MGASVVGTNFPQQIARTFEELVTARRSAKDDTVPCRVLKRGMKHWVNPLAMNSVNDLDLFDRALKAWYRQTWLASSKTRGFM